MRCMEQVGMRRISVVTKLPALIAGLTAVSVLLGAGTAGVAAAQTSPPSNDAFAAAIDVTALPATFTGTTDGATTETAEPTACGGLAETLWYRVQLPNEVPVEARLESSEVSLALYRGTELGNLKRHDCLGYGQSGYERVGFWALPGKTYYIQVGTMPSTFAPEFTLTIERFDEPEPYSDEPRPCSEKRYELFVEYNDGPGRTVWYLNAGSVPNYLKVGEVKRSINEALKNIADSRNDCGLADKVSIRARFGGTKGAKASNCYNKLDKLNVIEFTTKLKPAGRMCGGINAYPNVADIWMQAKADYFTTDPLTTLCNQDVGGTLDLESVLTHELGHAYGLDHVYSGNMTMYPATVTCTSVSRTLGLGDVLGLRRLY